MHKSTLRILSFLGFALACADAGQNRSSQAQHITRHSSPCIPAKADSVQIANAALAAILAVASDSTNLNRLEVDVFERERDGTHVTLLPGIIMSGGGGAVWVPDGGCAVVRELFD